MRIICHVGIGMAVDDVLDEVRLVARHVRTMWTAHARFFAALHPLMPSDAISRHVTFVADGTGERFLWKQKFREKIFRVIRVRLVALS